MDRDGLDDDIVIPSALNVLIGVWLVFSSFLLGYGPDDTRVSTIVCGTVIALLAYLRAARATRPPLLSWVNVALGTCVFAAGLLAQSAPIPTLNEAISGGTVAVLALSSAVAAHE